ncbi:acetyl-CoA synthetase-like protein [Microstroma glucosiphilum]|uniref:Acetyl-CoA synthetase-like protein n=1 Tax=Pseudomicrostroma glucosiphilum TaxID=1684307 RepID=A0A316U6Z3_9BASI|nr:acetyl-CoA synthetase-like protein [Pseudomicrostroma glucosiphilum]PWN21047.1 acetyl-CoA synthetase-like protein [Pseudomicrostroma glucosiphilum]
MIVHRSPFPDLSLPPAETSLPSFLFRDLLPSAAHSISPPGCSSSGSSSSPRSDEPLVIPPPFHEKFNPNPVRPKAEALSLRGLKDLAERWATFLAAEPTWTRGSQGHEHEQQQQPVLSLVTSNQHDYTAAVLGAHLAHPADDHSSASGSGPSSSSASPSRGPPGGVVALHNPSYTAHELAHQFRLVRTNVVLCSRKGADNVREAVRLAREEEGDDDSAGGKLLGEVDVWCFDEEQDGQGGKSPEAEAKGSDCASSATLRSWYSVLPPSLDSSSSKSLWQRHLSTSHGSQDAVYCFSSGTSGKPKAVRLSHGSLVANVIQATGLMHDRLCEPLFDRWIAGDKEGWYDATKSSRRGDESPPATGLVQRVLGKLNLTSDGGDEEDEHKSPKRELHIDILPQFHCYGLLVAFVAMHTITPRYILPRFSLPLFLHLTTSERCTFSFLVPPILLALSRSPEVEQAWVDLSSMRRVASGAASLPPKLREELWEKRGIRVTDGYGMSEMSPIICLEMVEDWSLSKKGGGGVGRLAASTKARVVDVNTGEDLKAVAPEEEEEEETVKGTQGELLLSGPQMMSGYLRNEAANDSTFLSSDTGQGEERWLRTGDIVSLTSQGYVRIHDRAKDVIKVSGFQVSPAELEEVILRGVQSVKDVAVVGVPVPVQGQESTGGAGGAGGEEQPWAFCVHVNGETLKDEGKEEEESKKVIEYVNSKMTKYKRVKGVTWITELPKNASGKVLKRELRDGAKNKGKNEKGVEK